MRLQDFNPEALVSLNERFMWMVFMAVVLLMLYGASNQYALLSAPHPSLYASWEREIPFIAWFIIPYMSSDVLFALAFLSPQNRLELRTLALRTLFIVTFSVIIFLVFPLQYGFAKPEIGQYSILFFILSLVDLPYNQLPSLHISFAVILWASMKHHIKRPVLKYALASWFWLIVCSTLLVYQHHFIDLPTGALMGFLALLAIPKNKTNPWLNYFTTPRSLTLAFYYLIGALAVLVGLFFVDHVFFKAIVLWIFIALFLVSIAYAFGFYTLLVGKDGIASWWQWLVFAPYFLGTYLAWQWYKKDLPLLTPVAQKVYVGRHLDKDEYTKLDTLGITHTIHLALEYQCFLPSFAQTRFAMFDITIPSPKLLHEIVMAIEVQKKEGVYVHCALGLSRSVIAIGAWLIYQGYSLERVYEHLKENRILYVKSDYMDEGLCLYQAYLRDQKMTQNKGKSL